MEGRRGCEWRGGGLCGEERRKGVSGGVEGVCDWSGGYKWRESVS